MVEAESVKDLLVRELEEAVRQLDKISYNDAAVKASRNVKTALRLVTGGEQEFKDAVEESLE